MLKTLKTVALVVAFLTVGLLLSSCGKVKLNSITLTLTDVQREYIIGEEPDYSNLIVTAHMSDGETQVVPLSEVTFSEINYQTAGSKTVTVTFSDKTAIFTVMYYTSAEETYTLIGYEEPEFVTQYKANIAVKTDKKTEFVNRTNGYVVGDDNPFKFLPELTAYNDQDQIITLNRYKSISTFEMKVDGSFVALGDNTDTYVAIDDENSTYDFTDSAIGKTFRLTVQPFYFEDAQPIVFTFEVQDGWNAYSAKDLSRLDNGSVYNGVNPWADYKAANEIGNEEISGLYMHNDIAITASDIPSAFIWQANEITGTLQSSLIGSLKDWVSIYVRLNDVGETFNFVGNYFTLNAAAIPLVEMENGGDYITSEQGQAVHSTLFGFGGDDDNVPANSWIGSVVVKNMNLLGNANRSDDQTLSGGLTFFRVSAREFSLNNTIARQVLTILCPFGEWVNEELVNTVTIQDSKGYDSFSTMFYMWGAKVDFVNSEYKNAGGPIMILAHVSPKSNYSYKYSSVTATNTDFESFVAGTEAWFMYNHADVLAGQIAGMLVGLQQYASAVYSVNYPIIKTVTSGGGNINLFNFIAVAMTGSDITDPDLVQGSVTLGTHVMNLGAMNSIPSMVTLFANQAPVMQSSLGGLCYFNGTGFTGISNFDNNGFFGGDYLNIYTGTMGVVLGLNNAV